MVGLRETSTTEYDKYGPDKGSKGSKGSDILQSEQETADSARIRILASQHLKIGEVWTTRAWRGRRDVFPITQDTSKVARSTLHCTSTLPHLGNVMATLFPLL
jgi:hypothetical protein